jgi:sec-independent protein translocase protein TatA
MPTSLALFGNLGPLEIGIILVVGLLLFGRRLPEVGRGLGKSIVEFKRGLRDVTDEIDDANKQAKSMPAELPAGPKRSEPAESGRAVAQSDPMAS